MSKAPDRKLPQLKSNKYSNVSSKLNTGATVARVGYQPDRRGEIFERVSRSLLAELLVQSEASEESVFDLSPVGHALEESAFGASYGAESNATSLSPTHSAKSARHPRAQDDDAKSVSSRAASSEPPFLLLDVRPAEEFMECQIRGADSFPLALLRQDKTTAALVRLRSNPERVLILCDLDEKVAQSAAQLFLGKQFPNVAILTGGLAAFAEKFPDLLIGQLPAPAAPAASTPTKRPQQLTASALASLSSISSPPSAAGSLYRSPSSHAASHAAPSVAGSRAASVAGWYGQGQGDESSVSALQRLRQRTLANAGLADHVSDAASMASTASRSHVRSSGFSR